MAFEGLSEKLQSTFKKLRGKGKLNEKDIKEAMREVKLALLEADVTVKFGKPVELPKRIKEEDKHEYDNKCMYILMRSIAELLPEEYRGVYK